jgi:Leucine-rich repeat (LRR) protein
LLYPFLLTILLFLPINKKDLLIMQVDKSTQPHTIFISQDTTSSTFFPSLLPLYGYYDKLKITMPSPLPAFATLEQFPVELIDMIQAFCSDKDLLSLTSIDKTALATRFCNPRLQKLSFKTGEDIAQFLSYCQAIKEEDAQTLISKVRQKIGTWLKYALSLDPITRFPLFTRDHLQAVKALTLTLSDPFTAEQYNLLFTYLPGIQRLTIYFEEDSDICSERNFLDELGALFKAAQCLNLHHLAVIDPNCYRDSAHIKNRLSNELWQLTTLETLTIEGLAEVASIPDDIGQLNALKSLTLHRMHSLNALPANLGQLNKLEVLILTGLNNITALPEEMGQLNALKSLKLWCLDKLKIFPASLWQLNKLEALTLRQLDNITALPKDIGQLTTLKTLKLGYLQKIKALPVSLGQLNKLEALNLFHLDNFTTLPGEIGQLRALKSLRLHDMESLEVLPVSLGQLDKLEVLTLEDLWITALPEEIGQLSALKSLTLDGMEELKALPASLGQLNKLEAISLSKLPSLTILPEEMGQLNALKLLMLMFIRNLRTLPASLGQLDKLETLYLEGMEGIDSFETLPVSLRQWKKPRITFISYKQLRSSE